MLINSQPNRRIHGENFAIFSRGLGIAGMLAGLACLAVAWLTPAFRITALAAAALSMIAGIWQWFAVPPTARKPGSEQRSP